MSFRMNSGISTLTLSRQSSVPASSQNNKKADAGLPRASWQDLALAGSVNSPSQPNPQKINKMADMTHYVNYMIQKTE